MIKISTQRKQGISSYLISTTEAQKQGIPINYPELFVKEESFFTIYYKIYNKYPSVPL